MRYLINRKTNEHERYDGQNYDATKYRIVEADSEGWIAHTGSERPISKYQPYQARLRSGSIIDDVGRWNCYNNTGDVLAYRPILAEKAQEPEYDPRSVSFNLLDRLKAAHKAAQQIPDLEKELREVLAGMGYTLGKLSPFVEAEPAVETPQSNALCTPNVTDAIVYGTSVMKNGKHVPLKDFYVEPSAGEW